MNLAVIGRRDMILGFSLAGVKITYQVRDQKEADAAFTICIQDSTVGIILIDAGIANYLSSQMADVRKSHRLYPIILTIPGSAAPVRPVD